MSRVSQAYKHQSETILKPYTLKIGRTKGFSINEHNGEVNGDNKNKKEKRS